MYYLYRWDGKITGYSYWDDRGFQYDLSNPDSIEQTVKKIEEMMVMTDEETEIMTDEEKFSKPIRMKKIQEYRLKIKENA